MTPRAQRLLAGSLIVTAAFNGWIAYTFMKLDATAVLPVMAAALVLALPAVIAVAWVLWRPGPTAAGVAAGVAIVNALEANAIGSLAFLGAWNPGDARGVMALIAFLVLPNLAAAAIAIVLSLRAFGRPALGHIAIGTGIALGMDMAAGIAAFAASTFIDIGSAVQYLSRNSQLEHAVTHVQSCAIRYAEQQPARGYPQKIEDMGPGGSGCLDKRGWEGRGR